MSPATPPNQSKPRAPDLPNYVVDPVEKQSADRLEEIASWTQELAEYKREQQRIEEETKRAEMEIDDEEREQLEESDLSTDPEDYDDVPGGAYITVKTTNESKNKKYRYFYWQWREGDSWKNEYIGPVDGN